MIQTLKPYLEAHPFFAGIDDELIELATGCAQNAVFKVDDYVFREGEDADQFYLVRHGRLAIEMQVGSKPIVLTTLSPGEVLGWSWLLPPHPWRFDARAVELTRVVSLDCACLRRKCEANHTLGFHLLQRSASDIEKRLYRAWTQVADLYALPDDRRSE